MSLHINEVNHDSMITDTRLSTHGYRLLAIASPLIITCVVMLVFCKFLLLQIERIRERMAEIDSESGTKQEDNDKKKPK